MIWICLQEVEFLIPPRYAAEVLPGLAATLESRFLVVPSHHTRAVSLEAWPAAVLAGARGPGGAQPDGSLNFDVWAFEPALTQVCAWCALDGLPLPGFP